MIIFSAPNSVAGQLVQVLSGNTAPVPALLADIPDSVLVSVLGNTLGAPFTMVALPAGHAPGMYSVGFNAFVRTATATGSFTKQLRWSAPGAGIVVNQISSSGSLAALGFPGGTGSQFQPVQTVTSSGLAPIEVLIVPVGPFVAPVLDLYAFAALAARLP